VLYCSKQIASMECKACGKKEDSRLCKPLTGAVYRNLYDLSLDGPVRRSATALHQFLAADPCVVCKVFYSALNNGGLHGQPFLHDQHIWWKS
jgi:hypothetical protein